MAFRDLAPLLAMTALAACDCSRGDYGSDVTSRETWEGTVDAAQPNASFRIELETNSTERTTLEWSELVILAGWDAIDDAEVDVTLSLEDESLGSFELIGSSENHTEAGMVDVARIAPLVLDVCVRFSLRNAGAMNILVNGVRYRFNIEEGSDIDAEVVIVDQPCE